MNKALKFWCIALIVSTQTKCCLEELVQVTPAFGTGVIYSKIMKSSQVKSKDKALITALILGRGLFNLQQQDGSYLLACGCGILASNKVYRLADRLKNR